MKPSRLRRYWPALLILLLFAGYMTSRMVHPLTTTYNNGPIGNGQTVSGSVTGTDIQKWSFPQSAGNYVVYVGGSSIGSQPDFEPYVLLYNPSNTVIATAIHNPWARTLPPGNQTSSGTYSIGIENAHGSSYPTLTSNFTLNLSLANQPYGVPAGHAGGMMTSGVTYNGTVTGANMDMWTYAAQAGTAITFTMTNTNGDTNFRPGFSIVAPDGTLTASVFGTTTVTHTVSAGIVQTGNYILIADNSFTASTVLTNGQYSFIATGSPVLSTLAKADGAWCEQCYQTAMAAAGNTGGKATGEPISIATGNVYDSVTDYTTAGTNPLAFTSLITGISNLYTVWLSRFSSG